MAPYRGTVSGLNEAFYVNSATLEALIAQDPSAEEISLPLLRGRDIDRWCAKVSDMHILLCRHGIDIGKYPAIQRHLTTYRKRLEPQPKGLAPKCSFMAWSQTRRLLLVRTARQSLN